MPTALLMMRKQMDPNEILEPAPPEPDVVTHMEPWWVGVDLTALNGGNFGSQSALNALSLRAVLARQTLQIGSWAGQCPRSKVPELIEALTKLGIEDLTCTWKRRCAGGLYDYWFTWPKGSVYLDSDEMGATTDGDPSYAISTATFEHGVLAKIGKLAEEYLVERPVGSIHALVADEGGGVSVRRIGIGGQEL